MTTTDAIRTIWRRVPFKPFVRPVLRGIRDSPALPLNWVRSLRISRILWLRHGHLRSAASGECVNAEGRPLPWYTYPAIEYLAQLDFSDRTVFEFGCGNSTLFWSQRAGRVVSVEHDAEWAAKMRPLLPSHCTLILKTRREPYLEVLRGSDQRYDVIVIDGAARVSCSEIAPAHLTHGGMVILDNSDWFPEASENLRAAGLIEVDMTGFAPIVDHASTTSFYFARGFNIPPLDNRQPHPGIGSRPKPVFTPLK